MINQRSQVLRSNVPSILKFVPARAAAFITGAPPDEIKALKTDSRLIPRLPTLEGLCLRFLKQPTKIVSLDPAVELREIAPQWFNGKDSKASIAICGMGNLGYSLAGVFSARPDCTVRVLVSSEGRAEEVRRDIAATGGIKVVSDGRPDILGRPDVVTHLATEAVTDANLVIGTMPSHVHMPFMHEVMPVMRDDAYFACVPAAGGFNWKAQAVLEKTGKNIRVYGIGGVPWVCKRQGQGTVRVSDYKTINALQPLNAADSQFVTDVTSLLLAMPMINMESFLNLSLAPANQVLHPGILYAMFKDWDGRPLSEAPLFYEGLTQEGADILQALDDELRATARAIHGHVPQYWMSKVASLYWGIRLGYGKQVGNHSTLHKAIVTNKAYMGVRTPMTTTPDGLMPDFSSRFLVEDVPHGLAILKGVAEIVGADTPTLDSIMTWCQEKMGKEYLVNGRLCGHDVRETAAPQVFGITEPQALVASCLAGPS